MKKIKLLYPKLSYQIIGFAYEVFNELGYGYREKYYQKAFEKLLINNKITYQKETPVKMYFQNEILSKQYLDFLIEDKIIIEIKVKDRFLKSNIQQIYSYLKTNDKKLGLLINFTHDGIKYKRILNLY